MIRYNFDCVVDRHHTCATKIEEMEARFGHRDLLPFWIADMDFEACPAIIDALRQRLNHSVLGYTTPPESFWRSIAGWLHTRHGWDVDPAELSFMPGLKKGLGLCINYFSRPGDAIVIQPPVYHSFRSVIEGNGRRVAANPLVRDAAGQYSMDFEGLTCVMRDEHPAMMIVCNPHNPIGITWDKATLARLADIAVKHNLIVISDEIHCDMALYGNKHIPFASVSENAARCSITFGAPSKTFNIAGIVSSYAIVPDEALREKFFAWLTANEMDMATIFAMVATEAAFSEGEEWRQQMLSHIESNIDFVDEYLKANIPEVRAIKPQASYLVWLDFSALGLEHEKLIDMLVNDAHLAMNDGAMFGIGGEQHTRLNVGTQRAVLEQAMSQLKEAIDKLR